MNAKQSSLYCNTKNNNKKVGKNVFAWFTRNKLIPKATIKLKQAFQETLERTVRPRRGRVVWPIRVCAAGQGIVLVTSMSKLCTVYYFVRVCLNYIEGIACTNRVIKLRIFIFVLRRLGQGFKPSATQLYPNMSPLLVPPPSGQKKVSRKSTPPRWCRVMRNLRLVFCNPFLKIR